MHMPVGNLVFAIAKKSLKDNGLKTIIRVEPNHNHLCIALAARTRKLSGKSAMRAWECVSSILKPIVKSGGKLDCNIIRKTIELYIAHQILCWISKALLTLSGT
jgi:hypothetical protein